MYFDFAEMSFTGFTFQSKDLEDNSKKGITQIKILGGRRAINFMR